MKFIQALILFVILSLNAQAGKADTVEIFSTAMHRYIKAVVIKPANYDSSVMRYPVVYLLHGYDGNYSNWIAKVPELKKYADTYQTLIVCPDGAIASWYFDSPADTAYRYETHISTEVVHYIDKHYRTIADKTHRAITGLSMGGHGALYLGLRHSGTFGAAGSLSGGLDIGPIRNKYEIYKRIGDTLSAQYWHHYSVINLIENKTNTGLQILFDCGNRDIFIDANRRLHQKMLQLNIPHTYIERPGNHGWNYWRDNIVYHLLFFRNYFDQKH